MEQHHIHRSEMGMKSVQWTAYGCFGLAGLSVILAMANEAPGFLGEIND